MYMRRPLVCVLLMVVVYLLAASSPVIVQAGGGENPPALSRPKLSHFLPLINDNPTLDPKAIAAGDVHTCALTITNGVRCWGFDLFGQLGDGTQGDGYNARLAPVDVVGLSSGVQAIALGYQHSCALMMNGGVKCWGGNDHGELGDGGGGIPCIKQPDSACRLTPVDVAGLSSGVQAIVAGYQHSCALTVKGGVQCWGDNSAGQLGDGKGSKDGDHSAVPVDVAGLTSGVKAISAGADHTCALMTEGNVKCWGANIYGKLGDGGGGVPCQSAPYICRLTPVDVVGLTTPIRQIAAGGVFTCSLTMARDVECWGYAGHGEIGDGTQGDENQVRLTPTRVIGLDGGVRAISAGGGYVCAITTIGGVKCWGYNDAGQLGDGGGHNALCGFMGEQYCWTKPVDVVGLSSGVESIATSRMHTCAILVEGGAKCWGANYYGELGDRTRNLALTSIGLSSTPVDVVWP